MWKFDDGCIDNDEQWQTIKTHGKPVTESFRSFNIRQSDGIKTHENSSFSAAATVYLLAVSLLQLSVDGRPPMSTLAP